MIYIIGTGAIGKALAAFLKLSGRQVALVRGRLDDLPESIDTIRVSLMDGTELIAQVPGLTFGLLQRIDGVVLVASKSYGNEAIAAKLASKNKHIPVCLLQNGLNIERPFISLGFTGLYRCVLMVTSQFSSDGRVQFKPVSACAVGAIRGSDTQLLALLDQLQNPWFSFRLEKNIQPLIWKKVIANCVFNSICPLLETDNGIFFRNPAAMDLAERVIGECIGIAAQCGISMNQEEVRSMVLSISGGSQGQFISTLQDIRNGRPTEIGNFNHEIVRLAQGFNMEHLVQQTRILGQLTDIKSRL